MIITLILGMIVATIIHNLDPSLVERQVEANMATEPLEIPQERLVTTARVKSVYDGDTIVVELTKEIRVRMLDCWAPEDRTKDADEKIRGYAAKEFLQSMLEEGDVVLVDIPMTGKLQDSLTFGRVLAYIYKDTDDDAVLDNISAKMVEGGHATRTK
jgi:endonuclease YncB( thermonuclease family)